MEAIKHEVNQLTHNLQHHGLREVLTAHSVGVLVDLDDLRVHIDVEVALLSNVLVAVVGPVLHPLGELLLQKGGAHVGEPLLRDLGQLEIRLRQVLVDPWMLIVEELADLLHTQPLVPKRQNNMVRRMGSDPVGPAHGDG